MKSFKTTVISLVVILTWMSCVQAARILGLFATPSKSHVIVHMSVVKALAEKGHDITVVTSVPVKETIPRVRHIKLNIPGFSRDTVKSVTQNQAGGFGFLGHMSSFLTNLMESNDKFLKDPALQKLMKEESFDLVLLGYFFNDFHLGVAAHFNCPVAVIWMSSPIGIINNMVGNPPEISYVPNHFYGNKQPLNFWERVANFIFTTLDGILEQVLHYLMTSYYESNFNGSRYPTYEQMKKNVSLVLVNNHFSQGPIRPNVPAIVEIGGIQIKSKPNPLPKDIKGALDGASQNGAIYFSLGSNVYSSDLKPETIRALYNVFSSLKQKVLWKWETKEFPGNASNIFFKDWFPQDDILAHPNIKLFITHGGKGGLTEAEYHGVPMVAMPVMADQEPNTQLMVDSGFGLGLNLNTLTEDSFRKAVLEVLSDNKYRNNVKKFSELYRDRPQTAKEAAVFWIEYVIRHRGAPHMQSPYVHLNFFARTGLDVLGFLGIVIYIALKTLVYLTKFILCKLRGRCSKSKKKSE